VSRSRAHRFIWVAPLVVAVLVVAWLFLAPARIGGSTGYVTTHGNSMAPRFQSGDLALIRRAGRYSVGDVVAYRSKLLNTVVMHRIVAQDGPRYVFKGDNNDFLDPDRPGRAELIGKLWLQVPHGGVMLASLATPLGAAGLAGFMAAFLLWGAGRRGRRRKRRGDGTARAPAQPPWAGLRARAGPLAGFNDGPMIVCGVVLLGFLGLTLFTLTRPATKPTTVKTPFVEKVRFAYRAQAAPGAEPVYHGGVVKTGDPVFLRLVDRLSLTMTYRFAATAPHRIAGARDAVLSVSGPTGWKRSMQLSADRRFDGDRTRIHAMLDLADLRALVRRVETLTGAPQGGAYTVAITPRLHVRGTLQGQTVSSDFRPVLGFQLDPLRLTLGRDANGAAQDSAGLAPSRRGSVQRPTAVPNTVAVRGHELTVTTARSIAGIGLLLVIAAAFVIVVNERRRPSAPGAQVERRYRSLIVPIASRSHDPTRPPIDVTSIDVLAKLAEQSERLILHERHGGLDTYLVDDEGTLYRYQARAGEIVDAVADPGSMQ
jgi:signal peptidase I